MFAKLFNQALCVFIEVSWELQLLFQNHLENLVRVVCHEGRSSINKLICHDAQSVPVYCLRIAFVLNDFWSDVFWRTTEGVSPLTLANFLDEAKISELNVPILIHQNVFRLEISEYEVLCVEVLKAQHNLP